MVAQADIDRIVSMIVEGFDPLRIILFGSHARDEANADSDVDLLIVFAEVADKREAAIAVRGVLSNLAIPTDIIVTSPEEIRQRGHLVGTILRPALREGRILYERA